MLINKVLEWLSKSWLQKTFAIIILWVIALIPTGIATSIYHIVDPITFWQKFAMFTLSLIVGGSFQFIFIVIGVMITVAIITEQ